MGIFGWSYPPGCSGPPDEQALCSVCGLEPDLCNCPVCQACGAPISLDGLFNRNQFEQVCVSVADHFENDAPPVADWADKLFEARDDNVTLADLKLLWLLHTEPMPASEANEAVLYHTRRQ